MATLSKKTAVTEWELMPDSVSQIDAVAARCRDLVKRRALMAAGVAVIPIPGLDWLTDIGVLLKLIPDINRAFGLTEAQKIGRASCRERVLMPV